MGVLSGLKILEMAAIGPVPLCGMMLADMGAEVVRVDRLVPADLGIRYDEKFQFSSRGKQSLALDLKNPEATKTLLRMVEGADVVLEGFRPGVMERLGIGPDVCLQRNGRLVYGRMTGWGQDGPLAPTAGHDINYIALTGALHAIGERDGPPVVPLNLVGDYGGGTLFLLVGVLGALIERGRSGRGQVVDAAMVDGAASLMTQFFGMIAAGRWQDSRGSNPYDGGSHFYGVYETADGEHMAVGAIEPPFYAALLQGLGLSGDEALRTKQMDPSSWPDFRQRIAAVFRTRTRAQWVATFDGTDACVTPVLRIGEAAAHPHTSGRATFVDVHGGVQPAPAPRFSRTPSSIRSGPASTGANSTEVLRSWGFDDSDVARLRACGATR